MLDKEIMDMGKLELCITFIYLQIASDLHGNLMVVGAYK